MSQTAIGRSSFRGLPTSKRFNDFANTDWEAEELMKDIIIPGAGASNKRVELSIRVAHRYAITNIFCTRSPV
jgi:hypothetical protein